MNRDDSVMETLDALMKARRRAAHGRLLQWAESRERIGAMPSTMGRIREMQEHAGSRGVPDRAQMNAVEGACDVIATALRVERFVKAMPREWIAVVVGVYLRGQTQVALAGELGIERNRVVARLQDAQDRLASEFEAEAASRLTDLTSACKSVDSRHAAQLRPAA